MVTHTHKVRLDPINVFHGCRVHSVYGPGQWEMALHCNARRRYNETPSLIGWAHTQNDPRVVTLFPCRCCLVLSLHHLFLLSTMEVVTMYHCFHHDGCYNVSPCHDFTHFWFWCLSAFLRPTSQYSPATWDHGAGGRFNVKMPSYQYRKSHCGNKTILWPSYFHNGIFHTGKMWSLYLNGALVSMSRCLLTNREDPHMEMSWSSHITWSCTGKMASWCWNGPKCQGPFSVSCLE